METYDYIECVLESKFKSLMLDDFHVVYLDEMFKRLKERYNKHINGHHNMRHIYECILFDLHDCINILENPSAFELALFYHDVIYKPFDVENELYSSVYLYNEMKPIGISDTDLLHGMMLIQSSDYSKNFPFFSEDQYYFHDVDFSILGSSWERFLMYENGVAEEYQKNKNQKLYLEGRINFLEKSLNTKKLFITKLFQDKYEDSSRENISRMINTLKEELNGAM